MDKTRLLLIVYKGLFAFKLVQLQLLQRIGLYINFILRKNKIADSILCQHNSAI